MKTIRRNTRKRTRRPKPKQYKYRKTFRRSRRLGGSSHLYLQTDDLIEIPDHFPPHYVMTLDDFDLDVITFRYADLATAQSPVRARVIFRGAEMSTTYESDAKYYVLAVVSGSPLLPPGSIIYINMNHINREIAPPI